MRYITPEPTRAVRLATTALALAIAHVGTMILLPGINSSNLQDGLSLQVFQSASMRLSIFALGATPLLSAAIVIELLRTLLPSVRTALPGDVSDQSMRTAIFYLGLAIAAFQAQSVASALEGIGTLVETPGPEFRIETVAIMVAATALMSGLAYGIDRHGIGHGLWLLALLPMLTTVPLFVRLTMEATSSLGTTTALTPLIYAGLVALVTYALIQKTPSLLSDGHLLWASLLTPAAAGLLLVPLLVVPALAAGLVWIGVATPEETGLEALTARCLEILQDLTSEQSQAPRVASPILFVVIIALRQRSLAKAGLSAAGESLIGAAVILAALIAAGLYIGPMSGALIRLDGLAIILTTTIILMAAQKITSFATPSPTSPTGPAHGN